MEQAFNSISAQDLREYLAQRDEAGYQLIDVRQPHEYASGHLPGALLLPLGEIPARMIDLPMDRDLIFYCQSGRRSKMAAIFASSRPCNEGEVYDLEGGILAWQGRKLPAFPRVRMVAAGGSHAGMLFRAMDLEKGAERFYRGILTAFAGEPIFETIKLLAAAEEGHARLLYRYWCEYQDAPPPFAELFAELQGELLEGGENAAAWVATLRAKGSSGCMDAVEAALAIEYAAYDLYRNLAHECRGGPLETTFLAIAQAEKEHLRLAAAAAALCPPVAPAD